MTAIQKTKKATSKIFSNIRKQFTTDKVFYENECQANMIVANTMIITAIILAIVWLAAMFNLFSVRKDVVTYAALPSICELVIPAVICLILKGKKPFIKYMLFICMLLMVGNLNSMLNSFITLMLALPAVLSARYFNKFFTILISVLSVIIFGITTYLAAYFDVGLRDVNFMEPSTRIIDMQGFEKLQRALEHYGFDRQKYIFQTMTVGFIPKLFVFILIAIVAIRIASRGRNMVLQQAEITSKTSRIESELNLATDIQANMLPSIFPIFPEHREFDIHASMHPAKEVGGDFYDIFMLGDDKLAFAIADVSGKGVPAALFMVIAKTLIKNYTQMGLSPAEVFNKTNETLLEGNDAQLFVTAWLAILDLNTGDVVFANAGHNPPVIKKPGEKYMYLTQKPGFVLAGIEGMKYKNFHEHLDKGARVFLYTDGVPEATDKDNNMYGEQRLLDLLNNSDSTSSAKELIEVVKEDLDKFYGDAEQFDDITMVSFLFEGSTEAEKAKTKVFIADKKELDNVTAFVEETLEEYGASFKEVSQITLCVEEWFVNIASYAYSEIIGNCEISILVNGDDFTIKFKDNGTEFNPLEVDETDITLSAEDRKIGGLGIHMVKKIMDDVSYKYVNSQNILTMTKKIKGE